ncbi:MAG: hypothetical protein Tsb005_04540 [Gammaproteobacteria bacterium]
MAKKSARIKVILQSTESPYQYTTVVNPRNFDENSSTIKNMKLELRKFDPILRRYVLFRQKQIKK